MKDTCIKLALEILNGSERPKMSNALKDLERELSVSNMNELDDINLNTLEWTLKVLSWRVSDVLKQRVECRKKAKMKLEEEYGKRESN